MNGLYAIARQSLQARFRRLVCRLLPHSDTLLIPDRNELWLDGDQRRATEVLICKRCLSVRRRSAHGKDA